VGRRRGPVVTIYSEAQRQVSRQWRAMIAPACVRRLAKVTEAPTDDVLIEKGLTSGMAMYAREVCPNFDTQRWRTLANTLGAEGMAWDEARRRAWLHVWEECGLNTYTPPTNDDTEELPDDWAADL